MFIKRFFSYLFLSLLLILLIRLTVSYQKKSILAYDRILLNNFYVRINILMINNSENF